MGKSSRDGTGDQDRAAMSQRTVRCSVRPDEVETWNVTWKLPVVEAAVAKTCTTDPLPLAEKVPSGATMPICGVPNVKPPTGPAETCGADSVSPGPIVGAKSSCIVSTSVGENGGLNDWEIGIDQ